MAGIARPVVHGSRKQSTKVLQELIQMTEKLKNFPCFAWYTDQRYTHLCTAIHLPLSHPFCSHRTSCDITKQYHNYTRNTISASDYLHNSNYIMSESVQSSYVRRSSQHNFQCNSLSTFKHAVHIYIICLNSM